MIKLEDSQVQWDNDTLNYDVQEHNWPAWALGVIQEIAPQVKELETLHLELQPEEIVKVANHVQNACSRRDFMERFDRFAQSWVPQRIQNRRYLIQRQGTLRVVIPDQTKVGRRLGFHQGVFVGNGRGIRTMWAPFTEARDTNTVWFMDLDISREISRKVLAEKWSFDKFENECLKNAWPVNLQPGQAHLFFQEHMHGNVNNDEGYTRVSMDMRFLLEGEELGRRLPGGFMRLPGDYEVAETMDYTGARFITYAGWNSAFSKHIPLPMQRATIDGYCAKHKITYSSYEFENEYMDWQPGLEFYIRERPDGIVMSSMYALTDDVARRSEILQIALDCGVELHFANEACSLRSQQDLEKIETYLNWGPYKKGPLSWEIDNE